MHWKEILKLFPDLYILQKQMRNLYIYRSAPPIVMSYWKEIKRPVCGVGIHIIA
jgi:hypothetical protein